MRVGLFVPCYIDQVYPRVAWATLSLLESLGCRVEVPPDQTCCGQPLANAGYARHAEGAMEHLLRLFAPFDYVVTPSGSCALHVRKHASASTSEAARQVGERTFELCSFLTDILAVDRLDVAFPHRVALHTGCHSLRGLRLGPASELQQNTDDRPRRLLGLVRDLELVDLDRGDECCGFGGTFAVAEEALSIKMGIDRLRDVSRHGAAVIAGTDMSCLMHLEGLGRRQRSPLRFLHIAEILSGRAS